MAAREHAGDPSGLALAVKGGHNDEAHNHLDVGSYLVAVDSTPVLIDLVQPTYTALTFTDRRDEIWTMASSGTTCPRSAAAPAIVASADLATATATASALELDLAPAYPGAAGRPAHRSPRASRS